jgi:hypothetical protein
MAKKPTSTPALDSVHELPPAMDYAEHQKTYHGFVTLTKYSILVLAVTVVLLYFIIRP